MFLYIIYNILLLLDLQFTIDMYFSDVNVSLNFDFYHKFKTFALDQVHFRCKFTTIGDGFPSTETLLFQSFHQCKPTYNSPLMRKVANDST